MSTFMGVAWLDVVAGGDVGAVLADLGDGPPSGEPAQLQAWRGSYDGGSRVELYSGGSGYDRLGDLVAAVVRRTGLVWRAVVFLDHDEYGAEHVVIVPDGAGGAHRLHHVYVYPYDEDNGGYLLEGEPSMTAVPVAAGAGPGGTPGALVDDSTARALTAQLFGVTVERVHGAAERAARAHRGLGTVGAPVQAWLDAFGIAWVGTGHAPVNLRPGPIWRDAVAGGVVPRLPGDWLARDYDLVRLPAAPVMCVVLPGRHGGHAVVYPMYVPDSYGMLQFTVPLDHAIGADTRPDPDALLRDLIDDALPFFDRHGNPNGLWQLCRERTTGQPVDRVNPHDLRCQAATEVILGRYTEAATTYATLATALAGEPAPWARDITEEARVRNLLLRHDPTVVHDALTDTAHQQLAHLDVPPAR